MKPSQALPTDDARYLSAAEGWFELGNWNEAIHELEKITPTLRVYPDEPF
ncbi:MAG: hypothetical protein L0Y58_22540 [Verrucomicrobia subdivision 3 bacterium]|nr:hypothetical protein [Limisphaerales bacterium]